MDIVGLDLGKAKCQAKKLDYIWLAYYSHTGSAHCAIDDGSGSITQDRPGNDYVFPPINPPIGCPRYLRYSLFIHEYTNY